jgi:hypothetical protein
MMVGHVEMWDSAVRLMEAARRVFWGVEGEVGQP